MIDDLTAVLLTAMAFVLIAAGTLTAVYAWLDKPRLPEYCRHCELLGLCRRPENEGGECYHGCLLLKDKETSDKK